MSHRKYVFLTCVFFLISTISLSCTAANQKSAVTELPSDQSENKGNHGDHAPVIVLDPGHGGTDPGKVNQDGIAEKDINLQIALLLKEELESHDISVVLTRESDAGLYEEDSKAKKSEDMRNRCTLIQKNDPVCTISIHQNSYQDASVYGPQVFFYHSSAKGRELAELLQSELNAGLQIEKPREAKENTDYYILKRSTSTTVLVECGFLSNENEAYLLTTEEYQRKVARSICLGLLTWLKGNCYNKLYEYENI